MAARIPYKNSTTKQLEQRQKNLKQMWTKRPDGAGRKSLKEYIDPEEVRKLAAIGATQKEIANFFGVSIEFVRQHFSEDIAKGHEDVKMSIRRAQIKNAVNHGSNAMLIWLGKQYLGQTDKQEVDHNHQMKDLLKEVGYEDNPRLEQGEQALIEKGIEQEETVEEAGL